MQRPPWRGFRGNAGHLSGKAWNTKNTKGWDLVPGGQPQQFTSHYCLHNRRPPTQHNHNPRTRPKLSALPPLRRHLRHQRARQPLPPRHPCRLPLHRRWDSWRVALASFPPKAFLNAETKVERCSKNTEHVSEPHSQKFLRCHLTKNQLFEEASSHSSIPGGASPSPIPAELPEKCLQNAKGLE